MATTTQDYHANKHNTSHTRHTGNVGTGNVGVGSSAPPPPPAPAPAEPAHEPEETQEEA